MRPTKSYLYSVLFTFIVLSPDFLAQTPAPTPKAGTASIAGRVSVDGGVLAGLQVLLRPVSDTPVNFNQPPPLTAVTDTDGNYQFTSVPAGKYSLEVHAPAYVIERNDSSATFVIEDNANLQNKDFKLRRGGVITGKVTDNEGQPLIEEQLHLMPFTEQGKPQGELRASPLQPWRTDDRGVYRIFGIAPGRYLVYAGGSNPLASLLGGQAEFSQTYYPGTANQAEARAVEVRPGVEAEGVSFALVPAREKKGYVASGRVIESDTGKPVSGLMLMTMAAEPWKAAEKGEEEKSEARSTSMPGMATTNAKGEFRFENLANGSYNVTAMNLQAMMVGSGSETYAEPLRFEIRGGDATDLVLKMLRGTTISGTAVVEGARGAQPNAKLNGMMVVGMPSRGGHERGGDGLAFNMGSMAMSSIQPDGSFRLTGVAQGKLELEAQSLTERTLRLARVEVNGAAVEAIEVQAGTPVTGVRLVFKAATGAISGRVEVRGGTLPVGAKMRIIAAVKAATSSADKMSFSYADESGRFTFSDLLPGTYEVGVLFIDIRGQASPAFDAPRQTIVVTDKAKSELVLYVDLKAKEKN